MENLKLTAVSIALATNLLVACKSEPDVNPYEVGGPYIFQIPGGERIYSVSQERSLLASIGLPYSVGSSITWRLYPPRRTLGQWYEGECKTAENVVRAERQRQEDAGLRMGPIENATTHRSEINPRHVRIPLNTPKVEYIFEYGNQTREGWCTRSFVWSLNEDNR